MVLLPSPATVAALSLPKFALAVLPLPVMEAVLRSPKLALALLLSPIVVAVLLFPSPVVALLPFPVVVAVLSSHHCVRPTAVAGHRGGVVVAIRRTERPRSAARQLG